MPRVTGTSSQTATTALSVLNVSVALLSSCQLRQEKAFEFLGGNTNAVCNLLFALAIWALFQEVLRVEYRKIAFSWRPPPHTAQRRVAWQFMVALTKTFPLHHEARVLGVRAYGVAQLCRRSRSWSAAAVCYSRCSSCWIGPWETTWGACVRAQRHPVETNSGVSPRKRLEEFCTCPGIWTLFPRVPRIRQSLFLRNVWPDSGSMFFFISWCR